MPATKPACLHRERTPPRRCAYRTCPTWLSSANPTDHCWTHKGWLTEATDREQRQSFEDLMAGLR